MASQQANAVDMKSEPLKADARGEAAVEKIWSELEAHGARLEDKRTETLFEEDPLRFERCSAAFDDLLLDFSKEKIDATALSTLLKTPQAVGMAKWREAMFTGEIVNGTEMRAARHNLLRMSTPPLAGVADMREQFLEYAQAIRTGTRTGATNKQFTDIVNIGIGGSYLGPRLAALALSPFADGPRIHFVSNVDPWELHNVIDGLDPARTLFISASKSFGTQETILNLRAAIDWLAARLGPQAISKHICAITARPERARALDVASENIFQIWDWAGGRFSIWSSMGLCVAIRVGRAVFEEFLLGGAEMDEHFRTAPTGQNLPELLALIGIWRRNVQKHPAYVICPYEQRLEAFPDYIQQLEMESNGKRVGRDGELTSRETAPFVFGGPGANTEHSFFQKLHQGTDGAPVDFLVGAETVTPAAHAHGVLLAHCLAQSKALMTGVRLDELRAAADMDDPNAERIAPHRVCPGDRASTTIMYRRLDARTLGRLIALYEHKIFAQAVIWDIECFDQWGVELGKKLANGLAPRLNDPSAWAGEDASTRGLLNWRYNLLGADE